MAADQGLRREDPELDPVVGRRLAIPDPIPDGAVYDPEPGLAATHPLRDPAGIPDPLPDPLPDGPQEADECP